MTELQLYRFITENSIEYHWHGDKVNVLVPFRHLEELTDLFGYGMLCEGDHSVVLMHNYVGFEINDICEYHGINPENVFDKD